MRSDVRKLWLSAACTGAAASTLLLASVAQAQQPSAADALRLTPVQKGVEFDVPEGEEVAKCTIKVEKEGPASGWVVRNGNGQIIRKFLDTNGDNVVDRWSYYELGLEVYRDIDEDNNGKVDQCRWLNTAGTRWGLDKDEDGKIDAWKQISAEEVSAEIVAAIGSGDKARFARLLITNDEIASLGLGDSFSKTVAGRLEKAMERFDSYVSRAGQAGSTLVSTRSMKWTHFSGAMPGTVPAGTNGSTQDLQVYENVVAMVQADDKHDQMPIGTIVRVGDVWRVIDAPPANTEELASNSLFFSPQVTPIPGESGNGAPEAGAQQLMADLEKIDQTIASAATPEEQEKLNNDKVDLLLQLASKGGKEERVMWLRQLADHASAQVQSGTYPSGLERLKTVAEDLAKNPDDAPLAGYFEFRAIQGEYAQKMQEANPNFVQIQTWWKNSLEEFTTKYPSHPDAAEALIQLGLVEEFAGQDEPAKNWYAKIVTAFPNTVEAEKAAGALVRLNSVGKQITFTGTTATGQKFDLSQLRGKIVVLHYWATWCQPCKADMVLLRDLQAKYARNGLVVVGVNVDSNAADMKQFLANEKSVSWTQLFEEGGLDSKLAKQLGVLTLPTMLLIDQQGNVANRSIHSTVLDKEIGELVR